MANYANVIYALLAEFVGTFLLVLFTGCVFALTAAQGGNLVVSALAAGGALALAFYVFGRWSGAHLNPVVSFGFAFAGQMNWVLMLGYWVMQFVGAIAAGALVCAFYPAAQSSSTISGVLIAQENPWKAVLVGAFMAFFLVFTYLQLYRDPNMGMFTGLALGGIYAIIVLASAYLVGGSVVNPAQALGIGIFYNVVSTVWVPFLAAFIGSIVAVVVYKLMNIDPCAKAAKDACGKQLYDECGKPLIIVEHTEVDKCGKEIGGECDKARVQRWLMVKPTYGFMPKTQMQSLVDKARQLGFNAEHLRDRVMRVFTDRAATVESDQNLADLLVEANTIPNKTRVAAGTASLSDVEASVARSTRLSSVTRSSPRMSPVAARASPYGL